jgi:hypothetical protein
VAGGLEMRGVSPAGKSGNDETGAAGSLFSSLFAGVFTPERLDSRENILPL